MLKYHWFLYYIYALGCFGNRRVPEGLVPIIYVCVQKVVKKTLENTAFREKQVFVGLRSSPSLFYIKNSQNPPPGTPPGGPILTFLGGEFSLGIVK